MWKYLYTHAPQISVKEVKMRYEDFKNNYESYLNFIKSNTKIENFDFSFEEIDKVDSFYKEYFKKPEKLNIDTLFLEYAVIAYIGEAIFHYFGGEYHYYTSKSLVYYGYPSIIKSGPNPDPDGNDPIPLQSFLFDIENSTIEPHELEGTKDTDYQNYKTSSFFTESIDDYLKKGITVFKTT